MTSTRLRGFTLIEMMIVVAIVGILAAIAYPSYTRQMQQSRRADCQGVMMQLAAAMERDFSRGNRYRDIIALGNFPNQCPLTGTKTYGLALALPAGGAPPTTYTITATPEAGGPQESDTCGALSLTNTLVKGSGGPLVDCWK